MEGIFVVGRKGVYVEGMGLVALAGTMDKDCWSVPTDNAGNITHDLSNGTISNRENVTVLEFVI